MKTLVLVFHPNLTTSRVNRQLADTIEKEADVTVRRMYDIYPDGKIDVAEEQALLLEADRIVLQFPFYWYSSPALLKQWEDDVLTYGWAHGSNGDKLHGKELLISTTTGVDASGYVHNANVQYTVEDLLRPFQATNNLIGTRYVKPFIVNNALGINEAEIEQYAKDYASYALTPEIEILGDYEQSYILVTN